MEGTWVVQRRTEEIRLCISPSESLCNKDYPPDPLHQKAWVSNQPFVAPLG